MNIKTSLFDFLKKMLLFGYSSAAKVSEAIEKLSPVNTSNPDTDLQAI